MGKEYHAAKIKVQGSMIKELPM
jgi:hypothetical protein